MFKTRKAGCANYAEVGDNYMLYDKAITPSTGGKARKSKSKSKAKGKIGVKKSVYKKKGGVFMDNLADATKTAMSAVSQSTAPPATAPATAPPASKGGSRRGGNLLANLTDTMNNLTKTGGKKRCTSCKANGGGPELAPFAAALAFLATRFATDKNFKMKDVFGKKSSKSKSKSKSMSKSK